MAATRDHVILDIQMRAQQMEKMLQKLSDSMNKYGTSTAKTARQMHHASGVSKGFTRSLGGNMRSLALLARMKHPILQTSQMSLAFGSTLRQAALLSTIAYGLYQLKQAMDSANKSAEDFEHKMAAVYTILPVSEREFHQLEARVLSLSKNLGADAISTATALYEVMSADIKNTRDSMEILDIATRLSIATFSDQTDVVKLITVILKAYSYELDRAGEVADLLFTTTDLGIVKMSELAQSLGQVISSAALANVPLEQLLATITILTKAAGLSADEAIISINQLLLKMLDPSKGAAKAIKTLGVDMSQTRIQTEGLLPILRDVAIAADGVFETVSDIFPNTRAFRAAANLTIERIAQLRKDLDRLTDSAGNVDIAFNKMMSTTWGLKRFATAAAESFKIVLGNALQPIVRSIAMSMKRVYDSFTDWLLSERGFNRVIDIAGSVANFFAALLPKIALFAIKAARVIIEAVEWIKDVILPVIQEITLAILKLFSFIEDFTRGQKPTPFIKGMEGYANAAGVLSGLNEALGLSNDDKKSYADMIATLERQIAEAKVRRGERSIFYGPEQRFLAPLEDFLERLLVSIGKEASLFKKDLVEEATAMRSTLKEWRDAFYSTAAQKPGPWGPSWDIVGKGAATAETGKEFERFIKKAALDEAGWNKLNKKLAAIENRKNVLIRSLADDAGSAIASALGRGKEGIDDLGEYFKNKFIKDVIGNLLGKAISLILGVPGKSSTGAGWLADLLTGSFQHGGIVTKPMLGSLAEHGRAEAVIPLDRIVPLFQRAMEGSRPAFAVTVTGATAETQVSIIQQSRRARQSLYRDVVLPEQRRWNRR